MKTKDEDLTSALLFRLNPAADIIKFNEIIGYLNCINFIRDFKIKIKDENLLIKLGEKVDKDDIDQIISSFKSYFRNFDIIKLLNPKDLYANIKYILNNSVNEIALFKR